MSAWQFVTIHWGGWQIHTPRLKIHTPLGTNSTPRAHAFISTLLILYLGKISHGVSEFFHDPCWTPYLQHFNAGSKFKSVEHRVRRSYSLSYTQIQHSRNARPIYQNNNPKASSQSLSDEVHTLFSFTDRKLMFAWSVKQKLLFLFFFGIRKAFEKVWRPPGDKLYSAA